jgi:hypothetical protein
MSDRSGGYRVERQCILVKPQMSVCDQLCPLVESP